MCNIQSFSGSTDCIFPWHPIEINVCLENEVSMFCIFFPPPLNHALWHYSFMFRQIQREGRDTDSLDWCQDREYETTDALVSTDIGIDEKKLRRVTVGTHTQTEQTHTWLCRYRETVRRHTLDCSSCYIVTRETFPIWCYQSAALPSTHFLSKQNKRAGTLVRCLL